MSVKMLKTKLARRLSKICIFNVTDIDSAFRLPLLGGQNRIWVCQKSWILGKQHLKDLESLKILIFHCPQKSTSLHDLLTGLPMCALYQGSGCLRIPRETGIPGDKGGIR